MLRCNSENVVNKTYSLLSRIIRHSQIEKKYDLDF